ncbi:Peroxiredoxin [Schinkia azotoformans MEV2011]|uniref:Peroxiredoxin n=1 Tax=Schinkia azotoformans MEV2011 TaxID=1348973 RepID=A0A072NR06_SCHAZ|nr:TlpA disulfide reductase family protein [Schinkia azotoformans]KEF39358.1 Peroxiredoxin [Schinkia azotoformans MEV2011]MEC1640722.1 TlpA disulfide reductase family protein [Schinkia azotoformans]MEC1694890.1 TlpA disulfide reductase family protein [Schinkia azotoformans]MEC1726724.1 TlpA disulfide reductase family protein [Schinkia azotoformans]MEC1945688.1 TlpA disulfide reductase family protein [Schinkia azotoformans]
MLTLNKKRVIQISVLVFVAAVFFFLAKGMNAVDIVEVGDQAYNFELEDLDGTIHKLSDYEGKFVVVNFFATWCDPCIEEAPELEKYQQSYASEAPLLIIDRGEPKKRVQDFKVKANSTSTFLLDRDDKISKTFNVVGQPETLIIDPNGIIREKIIGPTTAEDLKAIIATLKMNGF